MAGREGGALLLGLCIPAKPTTRFGHSDRSEAT
jgi:hypothetical protein